MCPSVAFSVLKLPLLANMPSKKFDLSLAASGIKREGDQNSPPKKVPKVADMKIDAPRQITQRVTTNAPVQICVYPITERAGDLWANYKESPSTKIWQVQMEHDARPSITVEVLDGFNEYLKETSRTNPSLPDSVQKLQAEAGIKLILPTRI